MKLNGSEKDAISGWVLGIHIRKFW